VNRPRVIFLNRVYWPSEAATAQLLHDLATALAARGWPVEVICAGDGPGEEAGARIHRLGGNPAHGGLLSRTRNYLGFLLAVRRRLGEVVRAGDLVVPMTDPPMLGATVAGLARRRGATVIHWIQDIYPEIVSAHVGAWTAVPLSPLRAARDTAWRSAAALACVGPDMLPLLSARAGPAVPAALISNWAPHELSKPAAPEEVAAVRRSWGLSDNFIVAYSGNLGRVHEFATVLDAAERLRAHPRVVFAFVGGGARLHEVRAAVAARGLGNVRFFPAHPRAKLAAALAAPDAHLVTLRAGFERYVNPSKLAGALAAGRPVLYVGAPDCANARLVSSARCGAVAAPGDSAALAAAILAWADAPCAAAGAGRAARALFEREFTTRIAFDRWEDLLRATALKGSGCQ
jgi:glycosyltransferase involved in cell wall biosynthesis